LQKTRIHRLAETPGGDFYLYKAKMPQKTWQKLFYIFFDKCVRLWYNIDTCRFPAAGLTDRRWRNR